MNSSTGSLFMAVYTGMLYATAILQKVQYDHMKLLWRHVLTFVAPCAH
jgi:hypothetical protein